MLPQVHSYWTLANLDRPKQLPGSFKFFLKPKRSTLNPEPRNQVLGMTASARVETTSLIRTRLKEQLEETSRRAEVFPKSETINCFSGRLQAKEQARLEARNLNPDFRSPRFISCQAESCKVRVSPDPTPFSDERGTRGLGCGVYRGTPLIRKPLIAGRGARRASGSGRVVARTGPPRFGRRCCCRSRQVTSPPYAQRLLVRKKPPAPRTRQ